MGPQVVLKSGSSSCFSTFLFENVTKYKLDDETFEIWVIFRFLPVFFGQTDYDTDRLVTNRLFHARGRDSQAQEMFLTPSTGKEACNHDTESLNQHASQSP